MKDDSMKIEQRLQNMKNFYTKVGDLLDNLPDAIPEKARQKIRDTILGDEELKNLMDGVDSHRPPPDFPHRADRRGKKQPDQCPLRCIRCACQ